MDRLDRLLEPGHILGGTLVNAMLQDRLRLAELAPGTQLGAYRIMRELGRGGMGIVYLATRTDGAYRAEVAIKWLPIGAMAADAVEQFRRERQTLADLRHPHIARLLDGGGSEDGHLWFAMEYVDGPSIDRHVAQAQLGWRERVQMLLPVVDAVQSAHGRLCIHRDIKPDNVLVDKDGRAILVDFGIAALLGATDACTAFTEDYASPEQRRGSKPAVGDDIWQLGRLLHVVLQATAPGRTAPPCPADLAAIIHQATAQDPTQRYPSASALAADMRRLLSCRPVSARRPTPWHRLRLLIQAHPLGSLASLAFCLAFAATIAGFMLRLSHQRDVAEKARRSAEAVNAFIENDLLPGNDPLQGGIDLSLGDMAERALERSELRLHDSPDVAAQVQTNLGRTLASLGRPRSAERAFSLAIAHHTALYGPLDARTLRVRLLREQQRYAHSDLSNGDARLLALRRDVLVGPGRASDLLLEVDAALGHAAFIRDDFLTCIARYDALLPKLAHSDPILHSDVLVNLSMCESRHGDSAQALAHARTAHSLASAAFGGQHPYALESLIAEETALMSMGRYGEATTVVHSLVDSFRQRYGRDHPVTLFAEHDLGYSQICAGKPELAISWLEMASTGRARILGSSHPWSVHSESVLGMALIQTHRLAEAATALTRARKALGGKAADTPFVHMTLLENEADLALAQGQPALALERYTAAIALAGTLYPESHPRLAILHIGLGLALIDSGQTGSGRSTLATALRRLDPHPSCRQYQVNAARRAIGRTMH